MPVYAWIAYLFLYAPIALIVLFSFNAGRYAADLQGFSVVWYGRALANPFMVEALRTSLIVGVDWWRWWRLPPCWRTSSRPSPCRWRAPRR